MLNVTFACQLPRPTPLLHFLVFFFFNDTATTEIYTLSLHDALPISAARLIADAVARHGRLDILVNNVGGSRNAKIRSEEHTSELQSRPHLVCRLLLEKKKSKDHTFRTSLQRLVQSPPRIHVECKML